MSEWEEYTLGELADVQTGPFGSQLHASDYVEVGIPSIMPKDIGQRLDISTDSIAHITKDDAERLQKYQVKPNDIVFSRRGDVEKCAYITADMDGWLCGTGCLKIDFFSKQIFPKFAAYYFSTAESKNWLTSHAVGTTMPNLNSKILGNFPILLPSLSEQKAITTVLSSLDDKIDLLQRQNATLEAMAQTLFRQWFVEEAEDDWENGTLDDVLTTKGGTTPSTKKPDFWDGDIHWTTPRDLSNNDSPYLLDTARKITQAGLDKISSGLLPTGTLLLSSRAPVGYLGFADIPLAINQGYIAILDNKGVSKLFLYLWLKENMDYVKSFANGSTFLEISKSAFRTLEISIPPITLREQFDGIVLPLFEKIRKNVYQIHVLEKLRNILLPKLMSGEATVQYHNRGK